MRSRNRSSGIGYTATSMAVVLAIAFGAMYVSDRRARADRAGAVPAHPNEAEVGPAPPRDDRETAARPAAGPDNPRTGEGETETSTDAARRPPADTGASASTASGGRGPSSADGTHPGAEPVELTEPVTRVADAGVVPIGP